MEGICGVGILFLEVQYLMKYLSKSVYILQVLYKNVAHPKLASFIKRHSWVVESGEYLMFPQTQSEFKGGVSHYLESVEGVISFSLFIFCAVSFLS